MDSTVVTAIISFIGIAITAVFGWLSSRVTSRSQKAISETEARGPEWQQFVDAMQDHFKEMLKERDARLEKQEYRAAEQDKRIDSLERTVQTLKNRYLSAVEHIRDWRELHPESVGKLSPPADIAEDI